MQNHTKTIIAMIWPNKVALKSTQALLMFPPNRPSPARERRSRPSSVEGA
jgi:hypothetical protein